jgi:drug/metabolite transporter (DMT)-like permease
MKYYIFPKYMEEAAKTGWIVRMLRVLGVLQVAGCVILGATVCRPFVALWLFQLGLMSRDAASASAMLIGLALGILVGLVSSLIYFAAAQALDDLHALRVQTEAFAAFETDEIKMGR